MKPATPPLKKPQRGTNTPVNKYPNDPPPRKPKTVLDENNEEMILENIDDLEDIEDSQKLDELRGMFGDRQYFLRIERENPETREMELCEKVFLNSFDPLMIGKKYGGGKFVASLFTDGGKYVRGGRMRFTIAKPVEAVEAPKAADPMTNPLMVMLIEQMKSEKAMLATLIEKMVTTEKPQQPISELLSGLKSLQDLSPKEKPEPNAMKQFMEFFALQKQMKDAMGVSDKEEGGPGLLSELTEALKLLPTLRGVRPVPRPGQVSPRSNVTGLPVVSAPKPTEEPPVMTTLDRKISFYLPALVEAATNQGDIDKWAAWLVTVLDNEIVPALVEKYHGLVDAEGVWDRLIDAASKADQTDKIFSYAPSLEPHRTWVSNVVAAALRDMTEDGAVPVTANGANSADEHSDDAE